MAKLLSDCVATMRLAISRRNANDPDSSDDTLIDYINDFYTLTMSDDVKLFENFGRLEFNIVEGQDTYSWDQIGLTQNFVNLSMEAYITNQENPLNTNRLGIYLDPAEFYDYWYIFDVNQLIPGMPSDMLLYPQQEIYPPSEITGISLAAQAVVTIGPHPFEVGDLVEITNVSGVTLVGVSLVNDVPSIQITAVTELTVTINVDTSTADTAYISGGFIAKLNNPPVNVVVFRTVPDRNYTVRIFGYKRNPSIAPSDELSDPAIAFDHWYRYIAYGAALNYATDNNYQDAALALIQKGFNREKKLLLTRTHNTRKTGRAQPRV